MGFKLVIVIILFVAILPRAFASSYYLETGFGSGTLNHSQSFFGSTGTSTSSWNLALALGLFHNFSSGKSPIEFHFGLETRSVSSASGSLLTAYPGLRIQLSVLYFSLGFTPWVWKTLSSSLGPSDIHRAPGATAALGEIGLLWALTPLFSLNLSGATQWVHSPAGNSPWPTYEVLGSMRFYFGFSSSHSRSSNEFKGWRYPFGNSLR